MMTAPPSQRCRRKLSPWIALAALGLAGCTSASSTNSGASAGGWNPQFGFDAGAGAGSDAAVQDGVGNTADTVAVDAAVDATALADGACQVGAGRCVGADSQVCTKKGWVTSKCAADTPVCVAGQCLACAPSKAFCADPAAGQSHSIKVMMCDEKGTGATISQQCDNAPCKDGKCLACFAGAHRCKDGKREVCAGGGLLWAPDHCGADKPVCDKGACVACVAGKTSCGQAADGSDAVLKCNADGTGAAMVEKCAAPTQCEGGACVSCKAGAKSCKGDAVAVCKADGTGLSLTKCEAKTPVCVNASCKLCAPSMTYCRAATADKPAAVMTCDSSGDKATEKSVCGPGEVCADNTCQLCAPGKAQCIGNTPLICLPGGKKQALGQSCHANGLICGPNLCGCPPAASYCAPPPVGLAHGRSVMSCDGAGKVAKVTKSCAGEQICGSALAGGGGGKTCVPCLTATKRCTGDKTLQCKPSNGGWAVAQDCAKTPGAICAAGACTNVCALSSGNPTHVGCLFWAVDLDNAQITSGSTKLDAQNAPFAVTLHNESAKDNAVTISLGPGPGLHVSKVHKITLAAGKSQTVVLPLSSWKVGPNNIDGTTDTGLAYKIASTAPLAVTQHNPLQSQAFSADASLLLPANAGGKSYRVIGRKQSLEGLRAYATVVATGPGLTAVKFTSSAATIAGGNVPPLKAGQTHQVQLQQGQVLNIETAKVGEDLTGSVVDASQPVAVFSGAEAAHAPDTDTCVTNPSGGKACAGTGKSCAVDGDCVQTCCADHIEAQLPPLQAWGKAYVGPRLQQRGNEPTTWRVLAASAGTKVVVRPDVTPWRALQAGEWFEFNTDKDIVIEASKPVLVARFMTSSGLTGKGLGDPAMIIARPVARLGHEASVVVPSTYTSNYLSLATPTGAQLQIDGKVQGKLTPIPGTGWSSTRVQVSAGAHKVVSTDVISGALYGWSSDGSYGLAIGVGLR